MANNNETPKTAFEYFFRGNKHLNDGDLDSAIADFSEVIRLNPDLAEAWNNRGNAWKEQGELKKAIDDYEEAIRRRKYYAEAFYNLGCVLDARGEREEAEKSYNEAIRLKPNFVQALTNRGTIKSLRGDRDGAIEDYEQALHHDPDFQTAIYNRESELTKTDEVFRREAKKRFETKFQERQLGQELKAAVKQIKADTKEFRDSYEENKGAAKKYENDSQKLLLKIGQGLLGGFIAIFIIELLLAWLGGACGWGSFEENKWSPLRLLPWVPVVAAVSTPFFLKYWALRKQRFETLTLAYGFQRKAIVEERVLIYASDYPELRKELLKIYVLHWMEKSPLEVMLAIGGKSKGMGGSSSTVTEVLREMKKTLIDLKDKTGKDGGT